MRDAALAATQAVPFSIGSLLADRYELVALLGEGGMGAVFRARDRELDEDVALKVLHAEIASDASALTRFRREVKLARRVTHRNVARTFDLGTHEGARFLTMELIVGESLGARRTREKIALPDVLRIAAEIARGLSAAHVVGVVHRDLKPDNVMLADDRVVLTDFGIARVVESNAADVMRTGMVVGTPAYMAPEQLENQTIDGRTDIYALGTILFELLAGRLPFTGESAMSIAAQRITSDAPELKSVAAHVPDALAALVKETLSRRREERPDAQALIDRLEALRGNAAHAAHAGVRLPTLTQDTMASLGQPRTVLVSMLEGANVELAKILRDAIMSALTEARVASVVTTEGADADLVVSGTLHESGDRVRARLRVSARKGASVWAGHVDGTLASSLDLEDGVVAAVTDAVRARTSRDPGPADPALRAAYDKARAGYEAFALPHVRASLAILEEMEAKHPGDPHVRTLLARCLCASWGQTGASDRAVLARAEELALRALETDESIAGAHYVIAQVRLADGELRAALRATEESLRHDPRLGDSHGILGALLCEALFVNEGRRRLDLAARLDPNSTNIAFSRITTLAFVGERDRARGLIDDIVAKSGPLSAVVMMTRAACWWNDREVARAAAKIIEDAKAGAAWDAAAILMHSIVEGKMEPTAPEALAAITANNVAPRRRVMMHEIAAEYFTCVGEVEHAMGHVVAMARLPATNLLWLDACPPISILRADARFSEARAKVAARCADLWGAVGTWPND
jgi:serine/threonine-protein kinase